MRQETSEWAVTLPRAVPRIIPEDEVTFSDLSVADDAGSVFSWGGRIFRAIPANAVDDIRRLFESGLLVKLIELRFVPNTWVTDLKLEGFSLVVEHARISPVFFPGEWSMEMLRVAALHVIEVEKIANEYNYELKDCHGYNVLFDGSSPLFVDIGSFVSRQPGRMCWKAEDEFLRYYCYPLYRSSSEMHTSRGA